MLMNKYHQLKDKNPPDWARIAERPHRVCTPKKEGTQCGHFTAQFAKYWNGKELVKDREDFHVSYQYIHVKLLDFFIAAISLFTVVDNT